jgi:hypothetical protein
MARDVYVQAQEELIPIATELLKEVKDEYLKKQKEAAKQHQQEGSETRTIPTSAGAYPASFACRLLGIRCSNLVPADMTPSTSSTLSASCSGSQLFMEQFLPRAAFHDKSGNHNHSSPAAPKNSVQRTNTSSSTILESPYKRTKSVLSAQAARQRQPHQAEAACPTEVTPEENADRSLNASGVVGLKTQARPAQEPLFDQTMSPKRNTIVTKFECPLCHQPILAQDNDALNRHIDSCLSASTVRQAVRESSFLAPVHKLHSTKESSKKVRLVDFWN